MATGPTNQQGAVPQPGSTSPVTQPIGPLPAETATGNVAQVKPVWANFHFLIDRINDLQVEINNLTPGTPGVTDIETTLPITGGPITSIGTIGVNDFRASGSGHARGTVPDPGAIPGITRFLREDATFAVPPGGGGFVQADYVVFPSDNAGLTSSRVLTAGTGITITDGGAKGPVTIDATGGGAISITATSPIVVTPDPITGTGDISHAASGVTPGSYGDNAHFTTFDVDADGHLTTAGVFPLGGFLHGQEFTSSGTFIVPANVTLVKVTMVGGGGGGSNRGTTLGGGGGGSGEFVIDLPVLVVSGASVAVTIGAAGGGASSGGTGAVGGDGGSTSFGPIWGVLGGKGGPTAAQGGGAGGGGKGAPATTTAVGQIGGAESGVHFGGSSGGPGGASTAAAGLQGGGAPGFPTGGTGGAAVAVQGGGGGGASSMWGSGGNGGAGGSAGTSSVSTSYGAGGGGAGGHATTTLQAGNGTAGYCLVEWVG